MKDRAIEVLMVTGAGVSIAAGIASLTGDFQLSSLLWTFLSMSNLGAFLIERSK